MTALGDALQAVLDAAEAAIVVAGLDVPERVFISVGPPALDCCDTLSVHLDRLDPTDRFPTAAGFIGPSCTFKPMASFIVTVARCYPVGSGTNGTDPPTPADLTAASQEIYAYAWAIWLALLNAAVAGTLIPDMACAVGTGGPGLFLNPSGGCAGATIAVKAAVIEPAAPVS